MPTATKTKPAADKPSSVPQRVRDAHHRMLRDGLMKWRQWARAIAEGGDIPNPIELLTVGALLRIPTPGQSLEEDAAAIQEIAAAENNAVASRGEVARILEPWGGDRGKLKAAATAAAAEAARLREILDRADGGCSEGYWLNAVSSLTAKHKRLFPEFGDEVLAALEVE